MGFSHISAIDPGAQENMKPTITTLIPTFRRPRLLARAISSALNQSYENIRVHVFDNNSGDDTEYIVRDIIRNDPRVSYTKNPTNIGAVNNIRNAVVSVNTDYYSILSDDDMLLPNFYEMCVYELSVHRDAKFICGASEVIDTRTWRRARWSMDWLAGHYLPSIAQSRHMYTSHFVSTGVLFHREVRDSLGAFSRIGDDRFYMSLAASVHPFVVLSEPAAVFFWNDDSVTGRGAYGNLSYDVVCESIIESFQRVANLDLRNDVKLHLYELIFERYGAIFSNFRFKKLMNYSEISGGELFRPGKLAVVVELLSTLPRPLRRPLGQMLTNVAKWRATESADWVSVTPALQQILEGETSNSQPVVDELRSTNSER